VPGYAARFAAPVFNEFALRVPGGAAAALDALRARGIVGGLDLGRFYPELADCVLMTATELTTPAEIGRLAAALAEIATDAVARS
jgi:glycine dehydrogenase subunit 1